jgi:serine/threonine protein kinase
MPSPEIASGTEGRINEKSDVYSLAMTIYALGTRSFPFGHIDRDTTACRMAREGERPQKLSSLGGLTLEETERLWSLMEKMWNHNPQRRPTMSSARDEIMRCA